MFFTQEIFEELVAKAKASERLRMNMDLRTTPEDRSQRMLNAMEPGTRMPIHRHTETSETMVMVRGKLIERFYDDNGQLTEEFVMEPGGECPMVQIPVGQWHSLEVLESGTVIFEAKNGPYRPLNADEVMHLEQ